MITLTKKIVPLTRLNLGELSLMRAVQPSLVTRLPYTRAPSPANTELLRVTLFEYTVSN